MELQLFGITIICYRPKIGSISSPVFSLLALFKVVFYEELEKQASDRVSLCLLRWALGLLFTTVQVCFVPEICINIAYSNAIKNNEEKTEFHQYDRQHVYNIMIIVLRTYELTESFQIKRPMVVNDHSRLVIYLRKIKGFYYRSDLNALSIDIPYTTIQLI